MHNRGPLRSKSGESGYVPANRSQRTRTECINACVVRTSAKHWFFVTQWEWLIEFRESVPYTYLHLGFDMRKHIPSPSSLATNSSTALCGERLQCRIPHIEGEIWLCDRCITHGERSKNR